MNFVELLEYVKLSVQPDKIIYCDISVADDGFGADVALVVAGSDTGFAGGNDVVVSEGVENVDDVASLVKYEQRVVGIAYTRAYQRQTNDQREIANRLCAVRRD